MTWNNPAVSDFKNQFVRDFPYSTDPTLGVMDSDITSAFVCASGCINQGLFGNQATYTLCYLLLSAHFLVLNLRASSQGVNGQFNFLQQSKNVGSVSESFAIPPRVAENPVFAMYYKTNYGAAYMQYVMPLLAGQMFTVGGATMA